MRIAIIGAGITGLRAGLQLSLDHDVTLFEKSAGVGGRVSTRRFENFSVNHGAPQFDRYHHLFETDPVSLNYLPHFDFSRAATALPKAMRDDLLQMGAKLMLNTEVVAITDRKIYLADKNVMNFEAILITVPVPQARKILGAEILPHVSYSKALRFIGKKNDAVCIEDCDPTLLEDVFDLSEEEIRERCKVEASLMVKKWRYARVQKGMPTYFCRITDRLLVAGDAFDPKGLHDLNSSWMSGLSSAMYLH